MERSPELDVLARDDDPAIADNSIQGRQFAGGAIVILIGLVVGYSILSDAQPPVTDMLDGDEEFTTTTFRPPSFVRADDPELEPLAPEIVQITPPALPSAPEEFDTTEFEVPPPPTAAGTTPDAEVMASPVDEFPARLRSKMIVLDHPAQSGRRFLAGGQEEEGLTVSGDDRNSKFLAAASSIGDRKATAQRIARIDALVPAGTLIPGILETAIVSDLPGQVRAIVSQDVFSFDGRRVLIPTGARLIGEYQAEITRGQTRVFIVWTRLLRDDGVSVRLDSIGADSLGRAGLTGRVDKRFQERFGAASLLSIVGAGASYLTDYGSQTHSADSDNVHAGELARETLAQTFADMANQALGDSLRIPPTINVSQGTRFFVFVRQDLDFSTIYQDPVTEALEEIFRERGLH